MRKGEIWGSTLGDRIREFMKFAALARCGSPRRPFVVPAGKNAKNAEQGLQKAELERGIRYCKDVLKLGLNA